MLIKKHKILFHHAITQIPQNEHLDKCSFLHNTDTLLLRHREQICVILLIVTRHTQQVKRDEGGKQVGEENEQNEPCKPAKAPGKKLSPYLAAVGSGFDSFAPGIHSELRCLSGPADGLHGL